MKVIYVNLDGTTFVGPLFNGNMELVTIEDKTYFSTILRRELAVGKDGEFIYPEETEK